MMVSKGDKVQVDGGPLMDVLAASDRLAICGWLQDGRPHEAVFEVARLSPVAVQLQQQPIATSPPAEAAPAP